MKTPVPEARLTLTFLPTDDMTEITWESPSMRTQSSQFVSPYTGSDLELVIRALDAVQHPDHPLVGPTFTPDEQTRLHELGLWGVKRVSPHASKTVGRALYTALIDDPNGRAALQQVRDMARHRGWPIRYIFRFPAQAVELAALPWEAMRDHQQAILFARGVQEVDSCERYLDLDMALPPALPVNTTLRILALAPTAEIDPIVRQEERAARLAIWEPLQAQGLVEWEELAPVTITSLDDWIRRNQPPDIVHFYGHGIYQQGQGHLLFDAPDTAGPDHATWVSAEQLAAMLGGIRVIMLCACQSSMVATTTRTGGLLTGVAPALSVVSDVVVAMQLTTRVRAATRFASVFYEEVARGRSVQAAVATARRSLYVDQQDVNWYIPTLSLRARDMGPVYLIQAPAPGDAKDTTEPLTGTQLGALRLLIRKEQQQYVVYAESATDQELHEVTLTFDVSAPVTVIPAHIVLGQLGAQAQSQAHHMVIGQFRATILKQQRDSLEKRIHKTLALIDELENQRQLAPSAVMKQHAEMDLANQNQLLDEYQQKLHRLDDTQALTLPVAVSYRAAGVSVQEHGHLVIPIT